MTILAEKADGRNILFWIGCGTVLISTTCQNVGMFIQKKSHLRQQMRDKTDSPRYWRSVGWWVGIVVFVFGVVMDFVSLSLLPTTVTLPLGSVGLVISLLCSHFGLHERLSCYDIVGLVFVITGACITMIFIPKERSLLTVPMLRSMLQAKNVELWYFLAFFLLTPAVVGVSFALPCALTYGICPGVNGTITMICGKIIGELTLQTLFYDNNQMKYLEYYAFVLCIVPSVLCQNHLLQRALAHYDNMIIVPVYYVCLTILNCLTGLLFFKDFSNITVGSSLAFAAGILIVCIGCVFLSITHINSPNRLESFRTKNTCPDGPVIHMHTTCLQTICPLSDLESIVDKPEAKRKICRFRRHPQPQACKQSLCEVVTGQKCLSVRSQ
ncbi:Purine permease-related protein [Giardia lamblia P15]|uniref:Purine permease-related protein n=1 Tax=Giardia intestinalis (strain P15) TaxID=658858 RepID=E1F4Q1_GIAIA|nr:Purine permease-related protein [Giardia lamblia P15]